MTESLACVLVVNFLAADLEGSCKKSTTFRYLTGFLGVGMDSPSSLLEEACTGCITLIILVLATPVGSEISRLLYGERGWVHCLAPETIRLRLSL